MRAVHALPVLLAVVAAAAAAVEIDGVWLVEVDSTGGVARDGDPLDRVWVFQRTGGRLEWSDHPRFEVDEADLVRVSSRGARRKRLRGSDASGWSSDTGGDASFSGIRFESVWRIDGLPGSPVFTLRDTLAGARTDALAGATRYEADAARDDGSVIEGRVRHDGVARGRFRMRRLPSIDPGADR